MQNYLISLVSTSTLFVGCALNICMAQSQIEHDTDKNPTIETIEVTAQKRVQSIQKVPISMAAFDGSILADWHITQADQILALTPNANATNAAGGMVNYFIRGVGMDDINLSSVGAVGVYLDDVSINNPMATGFAVFDLARVEVLRGPQNTLFGMNTTGGAVAYHTVQPSLTGDQANYWRLGFGRYNELNLEAGIGYAFSENSAFRLSFFDQQRDGVIQSSDANNKSQFGNIDRRSIRLQLVQQFTPAFNAHLSLHGGKQDQITAVRKLVIGDDLIDIDAFDLYTIDSKLIDPVNDIDSSGGFIKFAYQWPEVSLTAVSAIEQVQSVRTDDWGPQNLPSSLWALLTYNSTDTRHLSQEFQLKSVDNDTFDWLVGLSYTADSGDLLQVAYIDPVSQGRPDDDIDDAGGGPLFDRAGWVKQDSKTWSGYFNIDKALNEVWRFNLGYRLSKQYFRPVVQSVGMLMDDPNQPYPLGTLGWYSLGNPDFNVITDAVSFDRIERFIQANNGVAATSAIDQDFTEWGAKVGISAQLTDTFMSYFHLSRGFKMGAVNSNPSSATFTSLLGTVVKPETLMTAEWGFKSDWQDRHLRLNGALFINHWRDYQYFLVSNPGPPQLLLPTLVNIPRAKSKGAELELVWQPQNSIVLSVSGGWLDTEITDANIDTSGIPEANLANFSAQVQPGNELTNAPRLNYNLDLKKFFTPSWASVMVGLNYHYQSAHTHQFAGNNSQTWLQNFSENDTGLFNMNVQFEFGSFAQYQLTLWGKNLTDENYCTERNGVPATDLQRVRLCNQGAPLEYGISFDMTF